MTNAEITCRSLYRQCVLARDRFCQIFGCETPLYNLAPHHLFLRSQGNWHLLFDIDFGVTLCPYHHVPFAHERREEFWDKIIPVIRCKDEARAVKILKQKNSLNKVPNLRPDYKLIKGILRKQLKDIQEKAWMNAF